MSDCPRCQLPMSSEPYEGQDVDFCSTCWGHWVDPVSFKKILTSEVYEFTKSDKESIIKRWSGNNSTMMSTADEIKCPNCDKTMKQMPFTTGCGVVVDSCKEHGIWLDGGEIKRIQIYLDDLRENG